MAGKQRLGSNPSRDLVSIWFLCEAILDLNYPFTAHILTHTIPMRSHNDDICLQLGLGLGLGLAHNDDICLRRVDMDRSEPIMEPI